jgi:hypothetical protein
VGSVWNSEGGMRKWEISEVGKWKWEIGEVGRRKYREIGMRKKL